MKRSVLLICCVIVLSAAPAAAEIGIGISGGYPVGPLGYMAEGDLEYVNEPIFIGTLLRYQHDERSFGLEAEFLAWPAEKMFVFHFDGMLTARLAFVRLGFGLGFNVVSLSIPDAASAVVLNPDATVRLGFRMGPVSIGAGFSLPLNVLVRAAMQDFPIVRDGYDLLRLFAGQATANITYWF